MKLYDYDPTTLEYTGSFYARLDPVATELNKKPVFTQPAHSTPIAPLEPKEGYAVCFVGDSWKYFEDHRGETVYRKSTLEPVTITTVGPISALYLTEIPQFSDKYQKWNGKGIEYIDITKLRQSLLPELQQSFQNKLKCYFKVNNEYSISPQWWQTYSQLYANMKLDYMDGTLNDTYNISVYNNVDKKLELLEIKSIQQFNEYYNVINTNYKKLLKEYQQLLIDIENSQDSEQVINYVKSYDADILSVPQ